MSRWLIKAIDNDPNKPNATTNEPYNPNQVIEPLNTGLSRNDTFQGKEEEWETEQEKNNAK